MSALAMNETLTIARLGQRGDGVAETAQGQVFVRERAGRARW